MDRTGFLLSLLQEKKLWRARRAEQEAHRAPTTERTTVHPQSKEDTDVNEG